MDKPKPLKTKVFMLSSFGGNVELLYNAVLEFREQHKVVQIFANDLFDEVVKNRKVEVIYSTLTFGVSHQTLSVVGG